MSTVLALFPPIAFPVATENEFEKSA